MYFNSYIFVAVFGSRGIFAFPGLTCSRIQCRVWCLVWGRSSAPLVPPMGISHQRLYSTLTDNRPPRHSRIIAHSIFVIKKQVVKIVPIVFLLRAVQSMSIAGPPRASISWVPSIGTMIFGCARRVSLILFFYIGQSKFDIVSQVFGLAQKQTLMICLSRILETE